MGLEKFLENNDLTLIEKIAKGWTSYIYLVKDSRGKKFVLKVLREKSNRRNMVEKESENLEIANSVKVGPKLISSDVTNGVVQIEFIEGEHFIDWLFNEPSKKVLENFVKELLEQAKKLDKIGLDHGQLAGKGKNILVRNNKPVIIDFEKASTNRKCGNVNQLKAFLFINPNSRITKKVKEIMGEKSELLNIA